MFRSRRRTFTRKPRDYVWTTAIFSGAMAENTQTFSFLSSGEWEASSLNFERATLLRIRGYLAVNQSGASSVGTQSSIMMAIHVGPLTFSAGDFSPFVSSDYDATDVLWTYGYMTSASTQRVDSQATCSHIPIDVKAKRRMKSSEQLLFTCGMAPDPTASPTVNFQGLLRALVNRA